MDRQQKRAQALQEKYPVCQNCQTKQHDAPPHTHNSGTFFRPIYLLMLQPTVIPWIAHVNNCIDLDQAPLLS